MSEHSILPPSSAGIWGAPNGCTGWVLMTSMYPETGERPEAAEGDASHELAANLIDQAKRNNGGDRRDDWVGLTASNGCVFDDEMFDAAKVYADGVAAQMRSSAVFGGDNLAIEQRLDLSTIHPQQFGTPDCWLYDRAAHHLHLWDYKYGYLVVEAFENWQSLNYCAGIVEFLELNGLSDQSLKITITIAQPRAFHRDGPLRRWELTGADLRAYTNILRMNAHEALGDRSVTRSGPHCKYCSARLNCEAAIDAGLGLYEVARQPLPLEVTPQALGVQLRIVQRARQQLESLEGAYEEQAKALVKQNKVVPGWSYEPAFGREKWQSDPETVAAMGDLCDVDLRKPLDVMTPVQARKAGIPDDVVRSFSITPRSGIKLVPDNSNRVKQVFSK